MTGNSENTAFDDLARLIETLQGVIKHHGKAIGTHQYRTRMLLVAPLLNALGWDTNDPSMVISDYRTGNGKVDFALFGSDKRDRGRKPVAFIEVKSLGDDIVDADRSKALIDARMVGVNYVGLTNGDHWEFHDVFSQSVIADQRILSVILRYGDALVCARELREAFTRLAEPKTWQTAQRPGSRVRTYYDELNVEPSASFREIRRAYLRKIKEVHPDLSNRSQANREAARLNQIYEILSDAELRREYDAISVPWDFDNVVHRARERRRSAQATRGTANEQRHTQSNRSGRGTGPSWSARTSTGSSRGSNQSATGQTQTGSRPPYRQTKSGPGFCARIKRPITALLVIAVLASVGFIIFTMSDGDQADDRLADNAESGQTPQTEAPVVSTEFAPDAQATSTPQIRSAAESPASRTVAPPTNDEERSTPTPPTKPTTSPEPVLAVAATMTTTPKPTATFAAEPTTVTTSTPLPLPIPTPVITPTPEATLNLPISPTVALLPTIAPVATLAVPATIAPIPTFAPLPTFIPVPTIAPLPTLAPVPTIALPPTVAPTPTATATPVAIPTPTPIPPPPLRHIEEKHYMLELINDERVRAGLNPVVLGDNAAAQLHAEASLKNCFSSHWGVDGLKPYMRYSLAGGYQSNAENVSGIDYCIKASDGYRASGTPEEEIREAMQGLMESPGHRDNMLDPWHKKINIGLAWNRYNFKIIQHFEGDHVEYPQLPSIENGVLRISGSTKNGAQFDNSLFSGVHVYYDQPPQTLSRGQVARTYCYGSGLLVAALRQPLTGSWYYDEHEFNRTYSPCPDPYDVSPNARAAQSPNEAHSIWLSAYRESLAGQPKTVTVPWVTAQTWADNGKEFSIEADLSDVLAEHGEGVYSVIVWGGINGEDAVISEYSIFHGVNPPDTYDRDKTEGGG